MTIDTRVAARFEGRSMAWRLGASSTAAIGIVLVAWAVSLDVVKVNENGFFGDAATYYTLGHSLANDFDFEYEKQDLARTDANCFRCQSACSFGQRRSSRRSGFTVYLKLD